MRPPSFTELVTHRSLLGLYFTGASWARWIALGKALFNEPMSSAEIALFEEVTGRAPPANQITECDIVAGRGGGKDSFATAVATKIALASYPRLRPGEKATVVLIAVDRAQAAIAFGYLKGYFEECAALKAMVKRLDEDSIELTNNVVIEVHANSFRSVRGRSVAAGVLDEVCFWRSDESAVPDAEVVAALRPGLARMPGSKLILISSAYKRSGLLYQRWHENYGKAGDVLVARGTTRQFNPSFDPAVIEADLARDPELFGAEYLSEWRSDVSDFIDRELVASATDDVFVRPPRPGTVYFAFADAAGGRGDSFAVAIAHVENNLVVLDLIFEKRAPFDPDLVMDEIVTVLRSYTIARIVGDNYAAGWTQGAFERRGVLYTVSERKRSAIYLDFLPLLTTSRARLTSHARLAHQLLALERRTTRLGRDEITHPRGGADDLANVVAGALVLAASEAAPALIRERDLVPTDPPATLGRVIEFYAVLWICGDGTAAFAIFAKPAIPNKPLIIVDFERRAWDARMTDDIASQLDTLCENAGLDHAAASAWFYAPEALKRVADRSMCNVFAPRATRADASRRRINVEAISPKLLADPMKLVFSAHARTGTGKVQLAASALAKTRTAPLFGSLAVRPGERVNDDPLRVVLLIGIVLAFEVVR